jgi:biopolymer transport protein ExbB/TolQ
VRLTPTGLSGDITLTASRAFFRSGHTGSLFRITSTGQTVSQSVNGADQWSDYIRVTGVGAAQRTFSISISGTWSATVTLQRSLGEVQSRMQRGLALLATVGSTAPFVGLFGTVWGIYHALVKIGISGQASIDKVAGPVGEALVMTAIGLAVAVPAVLGYNWLVRRNKALQEQLQAFASDLHAVLLAAARP